MQSIASAELDNNGEQISAVQQALRCCSADAVENLTWNPYGDAPPVESDDDVPASSTPFELLPSAPCLQGVDCNEEEEEEEEEEGLASREAHDALQQIRQAALDCSANAASAERVATQALPARQLMETAALPVSTAIACMSYDGNEVDQTGQIEYGYLAVEAGNSLELLCASQPGHVANRFADYIYAQKANQAAQRGWIPTCVATLDSSPSLTLSNASSACVVTPDTSPNVIVSNAASESLSLQSSLTFTPAHMLPYLAPAHPPTQTSFSIDEFPSIARKGCGKEACRKQKELRSVALASSNRYASIDLTNSDFDWKALLKNLDDGRTIVGCGVAAIKFRLLPGVMDHNYERRDSGERHVFEIVRTDQSRVYLHFHKAGHHDPPEFIPAAHGVASHAHDEGVDFTFDPPLTFQDIRAHNAVDQSLPVGREQAKVALQSLLRYRFGEFENGTLNITDGVAFQWQRFLNNTSFCKELVGPGIQRVYALRYERHDEPTLVLCRADGSYVRWLPAQKHQYQIVPCSGHGWRTNLDIVHRAQYISCSWMQIREQLP